MRKRPSREEEIYVARHGPWGVARHGPWGSLFKLCSNYTEQLFVPTQKAIWYVTLEIGAGQLRSLTEIGPTSPFLWVNRRSSCRGKSYPVLCEQSIRRVHTEHVTTTTRNLPSWQSQGTDECCDSWLVLSPDRSFLGGSFPTGKQAQAPNDDKWNPLQTGNKEKT